MGDCGLDYFVVYQKSTRVLSMKVVDKATGNPLDISGATEIKVDFLSNDAQAPILEKKKSLSEVAILNGPGGRFSVTLDVDDTAALKLVDRGDFEAEITLADASVTVVRFEKALTVLPRLADQASSGC